VQRFKHGHSALTLMLILPPIGVSTVCMSTTE